MILTTRLDTHLLEQITHFEQLVEAEDSTKETVKKTSKDVGVIAGFINNIIMFFKRLKFRIMKFFNEHTLVEIPLKSKEEFKHFTMKEYINEKYIKVLDSASKVLLDKTEDLVNKVLGAVGQDNAKINFEAIINSLIHHRDFQDIINDKAEMTGKGMKVENYAKYKKIIEKTNKTRKGYEAFVNNMIRRMNIIINKLKKVKDTIGDKENGLSDENRVKFTNAMTKLTKAQGKVNVSFNQLCGKIKAGKYVV